MSVNKTILLGRLGKDVEMRMTQNGTAVANFTLATSERFKDRDGNPQERTEWHNIVLWGRQAEIAEQYLKKGDEVYIEGRIQTRKWTDKEGQDRYTTEIVGDRLNLIGGRKDAADAGQPSDRRPRPAGGGGGNAPTPESFQDFDDDIPFISLVEPVCSGRRLLARVRF